MIRVNKIYDSIKCLVIENFQTGAITVEYNKSKFEEILKENTFWEVTKIYELTKSTKSLYLSAITKENKDYLINKLVSNSEVNNEDKLESNVSNIEVIRDILPIVTDIPYTLEEDDIEELQERLENPSEVLQKIVDIVSNMLLSVFTDFINNIKSIDNLPKETQELLEMTIKKEELQKQLEDESELKNSLEELENIVGK